MKKTEVPFIEFNKQNDLSGCKLIEMLINFGLDIFSSQYIIDETASSIEKS